MLTMAANATYLAAMKHQMNNLFGGPLTFYLVGTAWWTARRKDGETGTFDWVALLVALGIGAGIMTLGLEVAYSQAAPPGGVPAGMYFFMSRVALLAGVGDIRMLIRRGVLGTRRIVRHLWRMCFALFIATGSFFLGQGSKVFPAFIIKSNVLFVPAILPLFLLIFWLVRVRFTNAYNGKSRPRGGNVYSVRA